MCCRGNSNSSVAALIGLEGIAEQRKSIPSESKKTKTSSGSNFFMYKLIRGGTRGGLEGAAVPHRNILVPRRKVKDNFFGDFWQ